METRVVSVRVKHIRPAYENLREWMSDPNHVYIGRGGVVFLPDPVTGESQRFPPADSVWANPFKLSNETERDMVIAKYKAHILAKIAEDRLDLESLRGKTLGCWCKPSACHGDVLLELLSLSPGFR